jgi:hypothetical protein
MSHDERLMVLQEFLDTPFGGIPTLWYFVAVFVLCLVGAAWLVVGRRRKH